MYLDFCIQVPLNTYLFQIKTKIADRHGRITDIVMYRDSVDDDNKLDDEMLTFEDMGFEGKPVTEGPVVSAANANAYLRSHVGRLPHCACTACLSQRCTALAWLAPASSSTLSLFPSLSVSSALRRCLCRSVCVAVSGLCVFWTPYLSVSLSPLSQSYFPFSTSHPVSCLSRNPHVLFYQRNTACGTISSHSICR